jgi:hypothetical protein
MRSSCASLPPQYSQFPPMLCSSHSTFFNCCLSGYRTGPPACEKSRAKKQPRGGRHAGEKGRGGAGKRKKLRVAVCTGNKEMQVARARESRTGKLSGFTNPTSRALGAVQRTLSVGGCGREIFCYIFFGHVLVAARQGQLPQQEKSDSADVQRGRVNISVQWHAGPRGDAPLASWALRRALNH